MWKTGNAECLDAAAFMQRLPGRKPAGKIITAGGIPDFRAAFAPSNRATGFESGTGGKVRC
jgi:hypothetical protein